MSEYFLMPMKRAARRRLLLDQVPEEEKLKRRDYLLDVQAELSATIQKKYIGRDRTGFGRRTERGNGFAA